MSRPMYETPEDLANEKQICNALTEKFGSEFQKLPIRYHADYLIMKNGTSRGWMEIKQRSIPSYTYSSFLIDLNKVMRMTELSRETSLPSILVVRWSDNRIGFCHINGPFSVVFAGRTDRNDIEDKQPCALIPLSNFIFIDEVDPGILV